MTWRKLTVYIIMAIPVMAIVCSKQYVSESTFLAETDVRSLVLEFGAEGIEWGSHGEGGHADTTSNHLEVHADFQADLEAADKLLKSVADRLIEAVKRSGGQPSVLRVSPDESDNGLRFVYTERNRTGVVQVTLHLDFQPSTSWPHRLNVTIDEHTGEAR